MNISGFVTGYQKINEWAGKKLGNTATLSGAIDIIVVEQDDGTFLSSPFYVRFGKFGALSAKDTIVYMEINEEPVDICMKLDDNGNATSFDILSSTDEDAVDSPKDHLDPSLKIGTPSNSEQKDEKEYIPFGINGTPMLTPSHTKCNISVDVENPNSFSDEKIVKRQISTSSSCSDIHMSRSIKRLGSIAVLRRENIFREDGKSLKFSSDVFSALNFRYGENNVEFSVTTAFQGTTRCKCSLFVWKWTDKIVISDIDGTITKSDVRGQLLPKLGKDWSQLGVASLFDKIAENGYRIAYLSARPIGQATETKEYLKSIIQGDIKLPDGPLLLTPDSLLISLHREVIIKKPEEFKIDCLQTIRKLFPEGMSPLYSGYGNRTNDVFAYTEVGIPKSRIFTINTKGELTHEITPTAHTSYTSDGEIVDHIFPPLSCDDPDNASSPDAISYSTFTYWREPFEEFDFDEIIEPSTDKK